MTGGTRLWLVKQGCAFAFHSVLTRERFTAPLAQDELPDQAHKPDGVADVSWDILDRNTCATNVHLSA